MAMWFLNTRSQTIGGSVCPVKVMDGPKTYVACPPKLGADVRGMDVLIGVHGFNVHQVGAMDHLTVWDGMLDLGASGIFLGALWPGDSAWIGALEYTFAAKSAMRSGNELAMFINDNFTGCASLSFVSHSLGARVALEAIRKVDPVFTVRRLVMMAPAIDNDCLTREFADAAKRVEHVSILASQMDDVLKMAFPLGNPISGIFAEGHPFWHAALGRSGPKTYPSPNNITSQWMLPDSWKVGHGDYLPPAVPYPTGWQPLAYPGPATMPPPTAMPPAPGTAQGYEVQGVYRHWQSAWTAALTSARFK